MDVKEYIESGVLEAYIMDALPAQERAQVEADMAQYPELKAEAASIEAAMLRFAESMATEPPPSLQDKIWDSLQKEVPQKQPTTSNGNGTTKIIPLTAQPRRMQWQRAAIWIALVGSLIGNALLWEQHNHGKQDVAILHDDINRMKLHADTMQQQQQQLASVMQSYTQQQNMLADSSMQTIVMHTAQPGHPMAATVYWSKNKGEAYVALNKLPPPPPGMQYQMWVIDAGKPVDLGMFPNNMVSVGGMQKLAKQVSSGQAFAISLEKEGGSPTPTMANIYVMGKVS